MKKTLSLLISLVLLTFMSCQTNQPASESTVEDSRFLIHDLNRALTRVVSEDLFPPPVASRIYAYVNIAAYEAIFPMHDGYESLGPILNDFPEFKPPAKDFDIEAALITAYCKVADHLVYRTFLVDTIYNQSMRKFVGPESEAIDLGKTWGEMVGQRIIEWSNQDGYLESRNLPKYSLLKHDNSWEPTQPTYGEALEPHWATHRPFFMDSSQQFRLELPIEFSKESGSDFYQAAQKVQEIVASGDSLQLNVAVYWDCNPGPTMVDGHKMQVRKQNTPGGHWMGIQSVLARKDSTSLIESCYIGAQLMPGIADGFIAAWETKFHHHLLRPETYINRYIDPDWKPKLESPLFPEFASAHSAISGVAASILSRYYGDMGFYDDTNVMFGLPPREFTDVWEAAEEAAKSRLLGGIHYEFGCEAGLQQGRRIGRLITAKLDRHSSGKTN